MNIKDTDMPPGIGDGAYALTEWICQHRDSLRAMLTMRMDQRLRSRVDPSDILQETFIEAAKRIEDQVTSNMSPRLWLRFLARQQLMIAYRRHVATKARDVRREQSVVDRAFIAGDALLQAFLHSGTTPSQRLMEEEQIESLQQALNELEEIDREILVVRHFEQLSLHETAEVLGISVAAASRRYYRALKRIACLLPQPEV